MGIDNNSRELVIIAKSRKHSDYCIAGIDCKNVELVRVITDNKNNGYAVSAKDIINEDGTIAEVLDNVVIFTDDNNVEIPHQPENIMLDTRYYVLNKGTLDKSKLRRFINQLANMYEYIFYNTNRYISKKELDQIHKEDRHSLEIVKPDFMIVKVKNSFKKTLMANIKYNSLWYNNIPITDEEFEEKYYDKILNSEYQKLNFRDICLVISLGEEFKGNYYKLIASVLNI